jgi:hypothetical protein
MDTFPGAFDLSKFNQKSINHSNISIMSTEIEAVRKSAIYAIQHINSIKNKNNMNFSINIE